MNDKFGTLGSLDNFLIFWNLEYLFFLDYSSQICYVQVLDFAVFPKPEFDLPIFCANFFTTASINIIVL